jgi:hypothetical protein
METETTVNVTQDHIDRGVAKNCEFCPVALALKKSFPGALDVGVNQATLSFSDPERRFWWTEAPDEVSDFIIMFDCGQPVEPFSFRVRMKLAL